MGEDDQNYTETLAGIVTTQEHILDEIGRVERKINYLYGAIGSVIVALIIRFIWAI